MNKETYEKDRKRKKQIMRLCNNFKYFLLLNFAMSHIGPFKQFQNCF